MGLSEYKLGELIEPAEGRNKAGNQNISGVDINKRFITTRANLEGTDITNYKLVAPKSFAANFMHIGRDIKLPVAYNSSNENVVVSPAYTVFRVKSDKILDDYLFILMNSSEFDRLTWFYTDSSVRGNLDWSSFCSITLLLPSPEVQQKAVDAYLALNDNLTAYTDGLDDLKMTCQAYIEKLAKEYPLEAIGEYIERSDLKNKDKKLKDVMGVSVQKKFREPKSTVNREELGNYKIVKPRQIAFVQTTNNEKVFTFGFNNLNKDIVVSSVDEVVYVKNEEVLIPEYLTLWFYRAEFDRYARYHSWGSVREMFSYSDLCDVRIPIPPKEIQQSIVDIYHAQYERQEIADKLTKTLREICPVLIKQSLAGV